ncbi:membrane protein insertion efficiency factor YidD [Tolypothrix campylonemoides VB511288_2]|uniref:Membrane protein insertion efficiency factor YidD n=2 Tax=Nostocales TaxID=1161 RepID=A0ABW8X1D1_9CYAN
MFGSISRKISVAAITQYQKHISPYKGFSCAHRILYGGESCSQYVKRVITQEGLRDAIAKSRIRFQACSQANGILRAQIDGEESTEETPGKKRRKNNCTKDKAGQSDCTSSDCDGGCDCIEGFADLATIDCSGLDCSGADCGSLDCGAADCGSLDCGSCGS